MDKRSKLTAEQKAYIVKCYRAGGISLLTLAERFGVSRERIGQIVQEAEAEEPTEGGLQTMRSRPLAERFWEKVYKNGPGTPEDRCWDWGGGRNPGGYGLISVDGKMVPTTHVAVFLADGAWPPPGAVVRHTCDRPCCIRRSHLIVGTQAENIQDAVQKGRHQGRPVKKLAINPNYKKPGMKGEKNPMRVLTNEQVVEIRERYADRENTKVTERSLAEAAGVNQSTIHKILNGELRPNAGGPLVRAGGVHSSKREEIRQLAGDILQMLRDGMSLNKVAKIVGVAKQTIQKELAEELKTVPIRRVNWNERPKPEPKSHVNNLPKPAPANERFSDKYTVDEKTGCWLWTGALNSNGVGVFWFVGKQRQATHVALKLYKNVDVGPNEIVRRRCSEKLCVCPDHVIVTSSKNNGVLTDEKAREYIARINNGESQEKIAEEAGMTASAIRDIGKRTHKHLAHLRNPRKKALTQEIADQIRALLAQGMLQKDVAAHIGICEDYVRDVKNNWKFPTGQTTGQTPDPTL